jgi:hypothetical protein
MQWLRIFIPSWRFFGDLGSIPILFYQKSGSSNWVRCPERPGPRKIQQLFFNPQGNLYLAKLAVIDRFISELSEPEQNDLHKMVLKRMIQHEAETDQFVFKIEVDGELVFQS